MNSNKNSSHKLTDHGSKKTFAFRGDFERNQTGSIASPNNISDHEKEETLLRLSQQSKSNSRSS